MHRDDLRAIEGLLAESGVTELMWNRHDLVFIERNGSMERATSPFQNLQEFEKLISALFNEVGAIKTGELACDGILPEGSRYHATRPPLSPHGPTLTIRKFSSIHRGLENLIASGFMTHKAGFFLQGCIKARLNILISGSTGAGKTTLLNSLISKAETNERIISVEDIPEVQLSHPNWVRLLAVREDGGESMSVRDCLIGCLRMRPDRIVVGECRSSEALEMLQIMNTGHDGCMSTIHANSAVDALSRLESLVLFHVGVDVPLRALRRQIADAVDLVIQVKKTGGQRYIEEIMEVVGMEGDVITRLPLFKTGSAKSKHQLVCSGHPPGFLNRLEAAGVQLPKNFFDPTAFES